MNRYKNMLEALAAAEKKGFTHNFKIASDGMHCLETGDVLKPQDVTIVDYHRFEGSTDPDDMSVLYWIEAARGLKGTIVDAYGTYSELLTDFMKKVKMKEGI